MTDVISLTFREREALKSAYYGRPSYNATPFRLLRNKGLVRFKSRGISMDTWELTEKGYDVVRTLI